MRVIVEVIAGPGASRRISLVAGQAVSVGRTEWADVSFPRDPLMSGTHFLLETDATGCYITDKGSRNGTFVNGQRISQKTRLRDGDRIVAGQTRFAVRIEGPVAGEAPGSGLAATPASPSLRDRRRENEGFPPGEGPGPVAADSDSSTVRPPPGSPVRRTPLAPEPQSVQGIPLPMAPESRGGAPARGSPAPGGTAASATGGGAPPAPGSAARPPGTGAEPWNLPPELESLAGKSFYGTKAPPPKKPATYTAERCDSGLTLLRGNLSEITAAELAVRLTQFCPLYLVVDFHHLGTPAPEELGRRDYVFGWLDPTVAAGVSPLVLSQDELPHWPQLLDQSWGKDAVVCLFSRMQKGPLVEHLQAACRTRQRSGEPSDAVIGCCWPSVLSAMLAHSPAATVQSLLAGIEAVLVELPDLPETWQVFGPAELRQYFERAGLVARS